MLLLLGTAEREMPCGMCLSAMTALNFVDPAFHGCVDASGAMTALNFVDSADHGCAEFFF